MSKKQQDLEKKYGKPIGEVLIDAFATYGTQERVATILGVSQSTVSVWLKANGLLKSPPRHEYTLTEKGQNALSVTPHFTLTEKGKNALSASKAAALAVESGLSGVEGGDDERKATLFDVRQANAGYAVGAVG